jgi:hypothetical protein
MCGVVLQCKQSEIHVLLLLQSRLGCLDSALATVLLQQQQQQQQAPQAVGKLPAWQLVQEPSAAGFEVTCMVRERGILLWLLPASKFQQAGLDALPEQCQPAPTCTCLRSNVTSQSLP